MTEGVEKRCTVVGVHRESGEQLCRVFADLGERIKDRGCGGGGGGRLLLFLAAAAGVADGVALIYEGGTATTAQHLRHKAASNRAENTAQVSKQNTNNTLHARSRKERGN